MKGQTEIDENGDKLAIYLVIKGRVDIYETNKHNDKEFTLKVINEGEIFGNYEFFTGIPRRDNAKSAESCTIIKIDRLKFVII